MRSPCDILVMLIPRKLNSATCSTVFPAIFKLSLGITFGCLKNIIFFERKILLENQQKLKTTLFTKYIHICTSHHQLHIQTLYIIPNVVFTMVKKAFIKWKAIEESSSTYIGGLSKINANILGI